MASLVSVGPLLPLLALLVAGAGSSDAPRSWPESWPEAGASAVAEPVGTWAWPVRGPVIRAFDPPESPFGAGHRGIDIAVPIGTPVLAPEPGAVAFAGRVGGQLFVTIEHGGGLASTYSWLSSIGVRRGDAVARGQVVAATGLGHPGSTVPHLHFGVKLGDAYVDPLDLLAPLGVEDLIRLVPLEPEPA